MSSDAPTLQKRVLIILSEPTRLRAATKIVQASFPLGLELLTADSIPTALELLDDQKKPLDLIIFENTRKSQTLVKLLFQLGGLIAYILCTDDKEPLQTYSYPDVLLEFVATRFEETLATTIQSLNLVDEASAPKVEQEYISIPPQSVMRTAQNLDIYVKIGDDRYVRLFKKGDNLELSDVQKYAKDKGVKEFFIKKVDANQLLEAQAKKAEALAEQDNIADSEATQLINESQDTIRDLVSEVGFTPEAQLIAKSSVNMALKLIGSRPKLSAVFQEFKAMEGSYISSHSLMLGKLACSLAYKVGWQSASTYLKLSMAAFMHDLPLKNNDLAKEVSYQKAVEKGIYSAEDLKLMKLHPVKAADLARQLSEIPADVSQIVAQHHERADGSGFPRGITSQYISPLAAIFIIAHDMIGFSIENPELAIDTFFDVKGGNYPSGQIKKIFNAIKNDVKLG